MPLPFDMRGRLRIVLDSTRTLVRDSRSRGVGALMLGGGAASLLGLGLLPWVTHLYQPETYAVFALTFAAVSVLAVVATGKYEQAIPLQERGADGDRRSLHLGALSVVVASLFFLVSQLLVILLVALTDPGPAESLALLTAPTLIWLSALTIIQTQLLTRSGRFSAISAYQLFRTALQLAIQIAVGTVSPSVGSLLLGFAVSLLPQAVNCVWLLKGQLPVRPRALLELGRLERHLPQYQAPTALVRALETNIALFVLAITYGDSVVALYAVALRIVVSPATLVASAANTVYLRESPHLKGADHYNLYRTLSLGLGAIAFVSTVALILLAQPVSALLGGGWEQTDAAIRATAPLAMAVFLGAIPSTTLLVLREHRKLLLARLAIIVIPNVVLTASYLASLPGVVALLAYSASMLACVLALSGAVAADLRGQRSEKTSSGPSGDPTAVGHGPRGD